MKTNIEQQILSKLPAKQADLWKTLSIDRRKISKLLISMEKKGIISRKKVTQNNITTYIIQKNVKRTVYNPIKKSEINPTIKKDYSKLLNKNQFSPCTGCIDICTPQSCERLVEWIK